MNPQVSSQASTSPNPARTYRVVQWATGNIGRRSLRAVIEHPHLQLVGLWVHSPAKVGKDAGELCGLGPVGVKATNKVDDIVALKADCVLYMQQDYSIDDVCQILSSGTNIVTTRPEFHHASWLKPADRARIEDACRKGNSSIHATGSSPGFITEALPIVLTSLQRRLDSVVIDEFADLTSRNSPELLFNVMGFGRPPAELNEHRLSHLRTHFGSSLTALSDALSIPLDSVDVKGEAATVLRRTEIAAGVLEAGTLGAQRITVTGRRGGRALLQFRSNWYCTKDVAPAWELGETGWRVMVEGDTPLKVDIHFPVPAERWAETSPGLTAHRPVNAIPYVCAAAPGIRTTADLPQIVPAFT